VSVESSRRQLSEQQRAVQHFGVLAKPYRFRVTADAEGFPRIPGHYGQIEWYCDGVNCWSCALPGQFALAVYTDRPRLFQKIWAIPGERRHQTGDTAIRAVFPAEALEQVAAVIQAKRWGGSGRGRPENLRSGPGQVTTSRPPGPRLRGGSAND
jgi:hypothetical protein